MVLILLPIVNGAGIDDLAISLVEYNPVPVIPGSFFTIKIKAENTAVSDLNNITFKIDEEDPFSVDENKISYSVIAGQSFVNLFYVVKVDSDAGSGFEELKLDYLVGTDKASRAFNINIQAIETTLVVTSVRSVPEKIAPGSIAEVFVDIKNEASVNLKDVNVRLDLTSENLPFAPIGSVTERMVDSLRKNEETSLKFKIITLADAQSKIYKVPLKINYYDETGKSYSKEDVIALVVGGEPELSITIDKADLIQNRKGDISIKLVNDGLTDIKFLTVYLPQSTDYKILSASNVYVGSIGSDDMELIDFELLTDRNELNLPLIISYKSANNEAYTKTVNLNVKVYSIAEAKQAGLIKPATTLNIFLGLIILIVVYFVYRKFKRRK